MWSQLSLRRIKPWAVLSKSTLTACVNLGRHPDTLVIALHKGASALMMGSGSQVAMVTIAKDIFVIGEGGGISLGLMLGMGGVGTGVGSHRCPLFHRGSGSPFAVCHHLWAI